MSGSPLLLSAAILDNRSPCTTNHQNPSNDKPAAGAAGGESGASGPDAERHLDFVEEIIEEDNRTGKHGGRVHTRFRPSRMVICISATPSRSA